MDVDRSKLYVGKDKDWKKVLWDGNTKQFFGRTASSWCKIVIFYLVFYTCLAGFFLAMMIAFYMTIDPVHMPKYTPGHGGSLLRHPALSFRPLPRPENVDSTLIWYRNNDQEDIRHWVDSLNNFMRPYEGSADYLSAQHIVDCAEHHLPNEGEVCRFQDNWFDNKCHKADMWGYTSDSPCIILKMNKMINWEPEVYKEIYELPEDMPEDLRQRIQAMTDDHDGFMPKMIWVSCEGENSADKENIGKLTYSPWQGFPAYYFPFRNIPGYLPPLVAVQFNNPAHNVLINIECRAWARNIVHDRQRRLGLVHFELLID